jgi:hypothetical protein
MPALVAGIHTLLIFLRQLKEGVDGRDKPGHDEYSLEIASSGRCPSSQ